MALLGFSGSAFLVFEAHLAVAGRRVRNFFEKVKKTAVHGLLEIQRAGLWKTRVKRVSGVKMPVCENVKA
jgi:hypothetical protein